MICQMTQVAAVISDTSPRDEPVLADLCFRLTLTYPDVPIIALLEDAYLPKPPATFGYPVVAYLRKPLIAPTLIDEIYQWTARKPPRTKAAVFELQPTCPTCETCGSRLPADAP